MARRVTTVGIRHLAVVAALLASGLSVLSAPTASADDPPGPPGPVAAAAAVPGPTKTGYSRLVDDAAELQPGIATGSARHTVFVQLAARGAAQVSAAALAANQSVAQARRAAAVQRVAIAELSADVSEAARAIDPAAVTIFRVANAVPGIGLTANSAALRALSDRSDVLRISEIIPKTPADDSSVAPPRALQSLTDLGVTGRGVRIGIVDTGIDYTHADFGGSGTSAAYLAARTAGADAWQPTAKVVGGFDFVGDTYDADAGTAGGGLNPGYQPVPRPDGNPLDCNGHGTHIAGVVAGQGVDAAGRTLTGDYQGSTGADLDSIRVPPGLAPGASLYALKVFGCSGSTDAVIPALDWALDPNGDGDFSDRLDVVDLSLTSTVHATNDPEVTVLDAIALLGVLPVVSVGNGGDDTDAAGSLAGSIRSLSVAASVDDGPQPDGPGVTRDSVTDLADPSSARGPHGSPGVVKPDVAAPGVGISSAQMGSGVGSSARSGPSIAAAGIAGIAALVRQVHPAWTPEQVKAAVMNTADHDVYAAGDRGPVLGPDRVGAGRADARSALSVQVLAYSSTTPGAVSSSFGVVPADVRQTSVVATSAVVVENAGLTTANLTLSYQSVVGQSGVSYQVTPAVMELGAGASALATVTMTITPSALRHTLDPGTPAQQTNTLTGLDEARQYVSSSSGRVLISLPGEADLRVPVYGAAKPVSSTTAADGTVGGSPAVVLAGTGFALSSASDPVDTTYNSMVSVLDLGYRSTRETACEVMAARNGSAGSPTVGPSVIAAVPSVGGSTPRSCSSGGDPAGDLEAVGAGRAGTADGGAGYLWFGLSTYGDWATTGKNMFPTVNIDTNGDNTADYTVQVQTVGEDSDLLYALLFDDAGPGSLIGISPVNFNLGNVDTNVFDTDVLLIPVDPTAIGYRPSDTTFPIRYSVATYSAYGSPQNAGTTDITPAIPFDVARPNITTSAPLWQDQGGTGIPYRLASGLTGTEALVLHLHGAGGGRRQIVSLSGGTG